jgi:hypothetical protein
MPDWRPVSRYLNCEFLRLIINHIGEQAVAFVADVGPVVALLIAQEMQLIHDLDEVNLVLVDVNHSCAALVNNSAKFFVEGFQHRRIMLLLVEEPFSLRSSP